MEVRHGGVDHPAVRELVALHRREALASTPADNAHALDLSGLQGPAVTFVTAWDGAHLLGMAALRDLGDGLAELKSMRTHPDHLRRGVARALLAHVLALARELGHRRLSLETGTAPMFDAANRMYEAAGFTDGEPFGGYPPSPHNRFMTLAL
jgi:putative acetyltransferase